MGNWDRIIIVGVVVNILVCGFLMVTSFNRLSAVSKIPLSFPKDIKDLRNLRSGLTETLESDWYSVLICFSTVFILKQTLSIPGSVIFNVLGGNLFGTIIGLPLVSVLGVFGASCAYWLASTLGRGFIMKRFPDRLKTLEKSIEDNRDNLLSYMMFIRLVPFVPHWFLNISLPIVGVPFPIFAASVFFGMIPFNFVSVEAGSLLNELNSLEDIFDRWTVIKLMAIAIMALIPSLLKRSMKNKTKAN